MPNSLTSPQLRTGSSSSLPSISEESLEVPEPWFVTDVEVMEDQLRGRGSYGTVHEALWQGTKVAVKKLHEIFFELSVTPESKRGILKTFARELNILYLLRHPNVVPFFGVYRPSGSRLFDLTLSFDTYLVQELMWCALDVRNRMKPRLNLQNVVDVAQGITSGLCYLHDRSEPIIHRDLATKNVLLSYSGVPKIADLGVAGIMATGRTTPQTRQPGTDLYMPPEVKVEGMAYNTKVDIYSFGVIILELCTGQDPTATEAFRVSSSGSLAVVPEVERRRKDFHNLGDHLLRSLILRCLSPHEQRPKAKDIVPYLLQVQRSEEYHSEPHSPIVPETGTASEGPTLNTEPMKRLSAKCEMLEEKVAVLISDKSHLEQKLSAYLQADREELQERDQRTLAELNRLKSENARLQRTLAEKETQISQLCSDAGSPLDIQLRGQRATFLHRINELEMSRKATIDELNKEIAELKTENNSLRRQIVTNIRLYGLPNGQPSPTSPEAARSSWSQGQPSSLDSHTSEIRKLKHLVEKYKSANIELDRKLKDANLDLQHYKSRQTGLVDHTERERLMAENHQLRVQLDGAFQENFRLQRELTILKLNERTRGVY